MPGLRSTILYCPVLSVTTERVFSISAGLDASTVTPGSTAPEVSLTISPNGPLGVRRRRQQAARRPLRPAPVSDHTYRRFSCWATGVERTCRNRTRDRTKHRGHEDEGGVTRPALEPAGRRRGRRVYRASGSLARCRAFGRRRVDAEREQDVARPADEAAVAGVHDRACRRRRRRPDRPSRRRFALTPFTVWNSRFVSNSR